MKKVLSIVALSFIFVETAFAATLEDRIAKIDASANKQIERVANYKSYNDTMRQVKTKQIQQTAELKKKQLQEWSKLKDLVKAEKAKTRKANRKKKA